MSVSKWFLVTNTENLKYYFDCNMIVEMQAFEGNAYLRDIQDERPKGYITVCSQSNLSEALKLSVSEDPNLESCIAELDLSAIKSQNVYARVSEKQYEFDSLDQILRPDVDGILIPAPLPIGIIKNIALKNAKSSNLLENELVRQYGEFPPKYITQNAKLFKCDKQDLLSSNPNDVSLESCTTLGDIYDVAIDYKKVEALGGVLSLTYYQTKNGRLSCGLFDKLIETNSEEPSSKTIVAFLNWLTDTNQTSELDFFFKRVLDIASSETDFGTIQHDLLNSFESKDGIPDSYAKVAGLAKRLRQLVDRTYEGDLDSYFAKLISHYESEEEGGSKPFLLISMIFVRDHIETALKFYHDSFTEEDYFLVAAFYGLFQGIKRVPERVRSIVGLRNWVSHHMVALSHKATGGRLTLLKPPVQPPLLFQKYIKDTANPKAQDNLQKFISYMGIDEQESLSWVLITKDEYRVKGNAITFSSRPKLMVKVLSEGLENSMQMKTIKDADGLFDFNKALGIFKA